MSDILEDPGTELDYEDTESVQATEDADNSKSDTSDVDLLTTKSKPPGCIKSSASSAITDDIRPLKSSRDKYQPSQLRSDLKDIYKSCHWYMEPDVLDLQRMADKFARTQMNKMNGNLINNVELIFKRIVQ